MVARLFVGSGCFGEEKRRKCAHTFPCQCSLRACVARRAPSFLARSRSTPCKLSTMCPSTVPTWRRAHRSLQARRRKRCLSYIVGHEARRQRTKTARQRARGMAAVAAGSSSTAANTCRPAKPSTSRKRDVSPTCPMQTAVFLDPPSCLQAPCTRAPQKHRGSGRGHVPLALCSNSIVLALQCERSGREAAS